MTAGMITDYNSTFTSYISFNKKVKQNIKIQPVNLIIKTGDM